MSGLLTSLNKTAVNKRFRVFIIPVGETFGVRQAGVSVIFALAQSEGRPTGPLGGWLVDRFGLPALLLVAASISGVGLRP